MIMCFCSCWMYDKHRHTDTHKWSGWRTNARASNYWHSQMSGIYKRFYSTHTHTILHLLLPKQSKCKYRIRIHTRKHVYVYCRRNKRNTCPCYLTLIREKYNSNGKVKSFTVLQANTNYMRTRKAKVRKIIFILYFVIRGNQLKLDDEQA